MEVQEKNPVLSKADIDWAITYPSQKIEKIKEATKINPLLDKNELILGYLLDLIYGDFNGLFVGPLVIAARKPEPTRQILVARLSWMAGIPEAPDELKEKLRRTVDSFQNTWTTPDDLARGERVWKENVQNEVVRRISPAKKSDELPKPLDPYRVAWEKYWEFEHGRKRGTM